MSKQVVSILRLEQRSTLDWLANTFGFALSQVTPPDGDELQHAQLQYGDSVMMASGGGKIEQATGKASTYLTVATDEEVDAGYARAVSHGAETVLVPEDQPYGGRNATVKDPEGNIWSIGSYQPPTE